MKNTTSAIRSLIIAIIVAGTIGALTVLAGDSFGMATGDITAKIFLICISFIYFGIPAAIGYVVAEKPIYKGLGNATMIVSSVAFLITLILIFAGINDDASIAKLAASLFIASIALGHISLLHHFTLLNKHAHTARTSATIFISIFSFIVIINIFGTGNGFTSILGNQTMLKGGVASLVLDLAATLLVPLCNRLPADEQPTLSFSNESKPVIDEAVTAEVAAVNNEAESNNQ
ncbi:MAG TPA: hypothetical protein PK275_05325 [Chitinophagaceae bacterium]|jgi:hypothetical protein|nr:hypothetical protein [Chitinophagaceae bacterium]